MIARQRARISRCFEDLALDCRLQPEGVIEEACMASPNPIPKIHVAPVVVLGMKYRYGYDCFDGVELCDARTLRVVEHDGGHHGLIAFMSDLKITALVTYT